MELTEARELAEAAYRDAVEMTAVREQVAKDRNKFRKVSTSRGRAGLTDEARRELDFWGFGWAETPEEVARAKRYVVDGTPYIVDGKRYVVDGMLRTGGGVEGFAALRAAGALLLTWYAGRGGLTATRLRQASPSDNDGDGERLDGDQYAPSAAVSFLAKEFVRLDPTLAETDASGVRRDIDAAFTVTRWFMSLDPADFT